MQSITTNREMGQYFVQGFNEGVSDSFTITTKTSPELIDAWNTIMRSPHMPAVKNVIFNYPATIIIWNDGTKTVVKVMHGDAWDPEKGLAMAYLKKLLGEKEYKRVFKKYVKAFL